MKNLTFLFLLLCALATLSCNGGDGNPTSGGDVENCTDDIDNDDDDLVDCDDADCDDAPSCQPGAEDCDNGVDDDDDGTADCEDVESCPDTDPNCDGGPAENCNTAEDDDADGEANCDDDDCRDWPACEPVPDEDCDNIIDDDFDGGADCADTDCAGDPACPSVEENCCNGLDDDNNGLTDFEESADVCDPTNTDTALPNGGDTIPDVCDNCPEKKNETQQDNDQDGVGNSCDNCTDDYNPDQVDFDEDGFGEACDCDDTDPALNPDTQWYLDGDSDGFGAGDPTPGCVSPGDGYVTVDGDCDDANASANPAETEVCDGADNDCDGDVDEDGTPVTWYADGDLDGYGDDGDTLTQCAQPGGYVLDGGDCNDADPAINPGATEACDGIDSDCGSDLAETEVDNDSDTYSECQGDCDDADVTVNPDTIWYDDADGDGYGDDATAVTQCQAPSGSSVQTGGDCDDAAAAINPDAVEVCDDLDNDCANGVDDGLATTTYYPDADGDDYGTGAGSAECANPGAAFATAGGDCDDSDATVNPGATESCNDYPALDRDCDGDDNNGCTTEDGGTGCRDGNDDDGDGLIDGADPDCLNKDCQAGPGDEWTDCSGTGLPFECEDPASC